LQAQYAPPSVGLTTPQTHYEYNLDKQLTKIVRPYSKVVEFNYGAQTGRLESMTLPIGEQRYSYDANTGHLTTITAPNGNTLSYSYDGFLPLSETWGNGSINGIITLTYDNNFRVITSRVNDLEAISYQYDADGLLKKAGDLTLTRHAQNGLLTAVQLGNTATQRIHNSFGEIASEITSYAGTSLYRTEYSYDKLGRIQQKTETIAGVSKVYVYAYDLAGRLDTVKIDGVTTEQYRYDANGNRLSATTDTGTFTGKYDDQDRLQQYGDTTYEYTANGELQRKVASGAVSKYDYDVVGNLRNVRLPNGTLIEYVIDGRNRRIGKKVNGALTQSFLYQGSLNPVAELDGDGNVVSVFVYGSKANVPNYMHKEGKTYRILSNHLGSPRLVVDINDGTIVQRMDYDAFGKVIYDSSPGFQPFGFAGGIYDIDTGLVHFGARDYDAEIGRWTAKDPILFAGGDSNLYGYVLGDAVNFVDSFGLNVSKCCRPANIVKGMVEHCWLKTDTIEAGMGATRGGVPGENYDYPFSKVEVTDHSNDNPTSCEHIPDVNEECVNRELIIGKQLGRFHLMNHCQSFTNEVISKCGGTVTIVDLPNLTIQKLPPGEFNWFPSSIHYRKN